MVKLDKIRKEGRGYITDMVLQSIARSSATSFKFRKEAGWLFRSV